MLPTAEQQLLIIVTTDN